MKIGTDFVTPKVKINNLLCDLVGRIQIKLTNFLNNVI